MSTHHNLLPEDHQVGIINRMHLFCFRINTKLLNIGTPGSPRAGLRGPKLLSIPGLSYYIFVNEHLS